MLSILRPLGGICCNSIAALKNKFCHNPINPKNELRESGGESPSYKCLSTKGTGMASQPKKSSASVRFSHANQSPELSLLNKIK